MRRRNSEQLILAKPMRGREMTTKELGVIGEGRKTTLMHEGYVEGQKYLVPDNELDVMKELVDYKLGRGPKDHYIRDYEFSKDQSGQDRKFKKMEERLKRHSMERAVEEIVENIMAERKTRFADDESETESSTESSSESSQSTEPTVHYGTVQRYYTDRVRFLISGHFRDHLKPIFIFHEFNGVSPFSGKEVDFSTTKRDGNVDIFIKGMFFGKTILEERNNEVISLLVKPNRIMIDRRRDKIYEEKFFELLHIGEVGVEIEGKFLKQSDRKKYTPFLGLNVLNMSASKSPDSSRAPTVLYLTDELSQSVFQRKPADKDLDEEHIHEEAIREEVKADSPSLDQSKPLKALEVHGGGNCVGTVRKDNLKYSENKDISNNLPLSQSLKSDVVSVYLSNIPEVVLKDELFTNGRSNFPSKNAKRKGINMDSEINKKTEPPPDCKIEHGFNKTTRREDEGDGNQKKFFRKEESLELPATLRHLVDPCENEPHLSKDPPPSTKKTSMISSSPPPVKPKAAGDIGAQKFIPEGTLVYNCEVRNRKSKKESKSLFKKFSQMFS